MIPYSPSNPNHNHSQNESHLSKTFFILSLFTPKTPSFPTYFKISHSCSFSTQNSVSSFPSRRHEEESRNVRVSVWWDFENCCLPINVNVYRVAQCITNAIRANGIKGPVQITAFGDVMQLSGANKEALSATGINLSHIPSGRKNSADRFLVVDLMHWVSQNPPPAHIFLISGDRDFAAILHRLRMNNYNILLASKDSAPSVLCSAASIMWQWNTLIMGENLLGKHFNQPPDGPYGSWYDHYKAPLEDPFASMCLRSYELSELSSDSKLRPIPKTVIKQLRRILYSHPKGILITELSSKLAKSNLIVDKDLYGYKKFSRFLLAMPHVLKLQSGNDGQFHVLGVKPKVSDGSLPSVYEVPVSNIGEPEIGYVRKPNGTTEKSEKEGIEMQEQPKSGEECSPTKMEEVQEKNQEVNVQESTKKVELSSPLFEIVDLSKDSKSQVRAAADAELGIFRRIWRSWFRSKENDSKKTIRCKQENFSNGKKRMEENVISGGHPAESVSPVSPSSHEATVDRKTARNSDSIVGKPNQVSSIFNQIMSWCKFWGSTDSDYASEESDKEVNQMKNDSKKDDVISNEAFWNELEAFMNTSQGSDLVLQSRTRVHLAENLQSQGPSVLRAIPQGDLLHLVDLLISDKKWVEESQSQTSPFKVISYTGKDQSNDHPRCSSGLSSMFQVGQQHSTLRELRERKLQNPPHTGVPQTVSQRDCSSKSRDEILIDCQKLVDHILKEYPQGFNKGSFRKLFLEKYGYTLDIQKLGYQKLVSLLQVMPGVTIESNYIFPFEVLKSRQESNIGPVASSDGESSDGLSKDDCSESPWEELGPVSNANLEKNEIDPRFTRKPRNERAEPALEYDPLGEDDLSDSEEELSSTKSEIEAKSRRNQEDSSLLQILDSWYSSQDDKSRKDALESMRNTSDCSTPTEFGAKTEGPSLNHTRKKKPSTSYSFVFEQSGDNKDRPVNGILNSLKKSSEKSGESSVSG